MRWSLVRVVCRTAGGVVGEQVLLTSMMFCGRPMAGGWLGCLVWGGGRGDGRTCTHSQTHANTHIKSHRSHRTSLTPKSTTLDTNRFTHSNLNFLLNQVHLSTACLWMSALRRGQFWFYCDHVRLIRSQGGLKCARVPNPNGDGTKVIVRVLWASRKEYRPT